MHWRCRKGKKKRETLTNKHASFSDSLQIWLRLSNLTRKIRRIVLVEQYIYVYHYTYANSEQTDLDSLKIERRD